MEVVKQFFCGIIITLLVILDFWILNSGAMPKDLPANVVVLTVIGFMASLMAPFCVLIFALTAWAKEAKEEDKDSILAELNKIMVD